MNIDSEKIAKSVGEHNFYKGVELISEFNKRTSGEVRETLEKICEKNGKDPSFVSVFLGEIKKEENPVFDVPADKRSLELIDLVNEEKEVFHSKQIFNR